MNIKERDKNVIKCAKSYKATHDSIHEYSISMNITISYMCVCTSK